MMKRAPHYSTDIPLSRDTFTRIGAAKVFKTRTAFVRHFLFGKRGKLLDVGNLGDGGSNLGLRELMEQNGGQYWGLDINKNLSDELGYTNQLIGDLHDLTGVVKDSSFDHIYAGQVIEHSWEPGKIISECARILKKDGLLILDTPNVHDIMSILQVYFKRRNTQGDVPELSYEEAKDNFKNYRAQKNLLSQPQHKFFYGPSALRQLLNQFGFALVDIVYIDKASGLLQKVFAHLFPQSSHKIGVVAVKKDIDSIFRERQFGDRYE